MDSYTIIKIIHLFANFAWMAGMWYLPRLFVYHVDAKGEVAKTLATMERRLLRGIINPAMIVSLATGVYLMAVGDFLKNGWMHSKLSLVLLLTIMHGMLARYRKQLLNGTNKHSATYFRWLNEIPTVILILILILVVAKPF
ncbi:MAG: protoporphyrinogen oxidase HemJ [Hydrotalea sp.]|nr:protoporphyrinogen oxidase HemJ [Hydrotalea sp.]